MQIAGNLTIQNWKELSKNLSPDKDENWSLAFHFFEERIRTRYQNPINAILKMEDNLGEGFAVVNLQCSLIETIESFINGWIYHNDKKSDISTGWYLRKTEKINRVKNPLNQKENLKNEDIFISFFKNRETIKILNIDGLDFYKSVRCGLLHETQTKNGWKIWADGVDKSIDNKVIYRNNFQRDIEKVIVNYKNAITKGIEFKIEGISTKELRDNFKSKFNHICDES
jgi:hypothetical protein